jgi:hypothetical protein
MNYQRIYEQLTAKDMIADYTEKHHIIPRCMGGSNDHRNLVRLTPEAHYVAHQLLVKIYPDNHKLVYAANLMCVGSKTNNRVNNKSYGWIKRKLNTAAKGKTHSAITKAKMSAAKQHVSVETRAKMSAARKGKPQPAHVANQLRVARLGKVTSLATRTKISKSLVGREISKDHKLNMSKNHANVSGSNNPNAKTWKIISPTGEVFIIFGSMDEFCKMHNLPASTMRGAGRRGSSPTSGKCVGWLVMILNCEQVGLVRLQD